MQTREPGAGEGISLALDGGEVVDMSPVGCPEGTTVIVRDLFFNTPARHKFMKSDRAEGSAITAVVQRCALSRPDISFRFIKDGKTEYHTPGDSRMESCIYSLLGREFEAGLLSAETSDENVSVKGFISSPACARGNRSYQFFFVNGRVIRSVVLQSALEQAYKNRLPSGRFPSCVLYITTKLSAVDVNVHPAKTEIKFISDKMFFDGLYYAALGALEKPQITNIKRQTDFGSGPSENGDSGSEAPNKTGGKRNVGRVVPGNGHGFKALEVDEYRRLYDPKKRVSADSFRASGGRKQSDPTTADEHFSDASFRASGGQSIHASANADEHFSDNLFRASDGQTTSAPASANTNFSGDLFRVIGEALNVYIIVECRDSVLFIDKHAAHERIHFDALKGDNFEPMSQSLITPVICRLGHEDVSLLLENTEFLDTLGFSVESFGEDAVAIRHIPAEIDIADTESVLAEICPQLKHSEDAEMLGRDGIYKTIACKAAIKAGHSSGIRELESLAAKVLSGEVSFCPHGRPVAFEITKSKLDKGMGRA